MDSTENSEQNEPRDYRDTLQLPQTDFPMKAGLPKREPDILNHWQKIDLYKRLRAQAETREPFILHDGPPYANGDIHIGHALNKILKDMVVKSHQMMGYNAAYIPGWDCHGLPIEWKIEEQYRQQGKDKDEVPRKEFRDECRRFAEKWIGVQSQQFQRLGIIGDWDNYYSTMHYEAEAAIVKEFQHFVMDGSLYRGSKPVLWSVVEKTALAEAEVEYEDYESRTLFVKFPIKECSDNNLKGAFAVIWTTTPWTLPANRAIAFSPNLSYGVYEIKGERLILCDALAPRLLEIVQKQHEEEKITCEKISDVAGDVLAQTICHHPLYKHGLSKNGYDFAVPILAADFVTDETGTGLVHIAPGHGQDDFELGLQNNIDIPFTIDEAGRYLPHVPLFAGETIYNDKGKGGTANAAVIEALKDVRAVLAQGKLRHQYPHSWRSK
ncbi:MAG: class I tRNA ligase family protein, partial [Alphaproteobacteria bacterium]|nr:class I tRNA ligase family protein [Alphaproteobacteria bacterium]